MSERDSVCDSPEILEPARVCVEEMSEIEFVTPILPDVLERLVGGFRRQETSLLPSHAVLLRRLRRHRWRWRQRRLGSQPDGTVSRIITLIFSFFHIKARNEKKIE